MSDTVLRGISWDHVVFQSGKDIIHARNNQYLLNPNDSNLFRLLKSAHILLVLVFHFAVLFYSKIYILPIIMFNSIIYYLAKERMVENK